jgi:hypothetical protein
MRMATYTQSLRTLQPIIKPIFSALRQGLTETTAEHARRKLARRVDPHFYLHGARRTACEELERVGLLATLDNGRRSLALSGISILHAGINLRMFHVPKGPKGFEIPIPGRSESRQRFWRQEPTIPGLMESDNLLLLWTDEDGELAADMELVRPLFGSHRRNSLDIDWAGPLSENFSTMRASDLDQLRPRIKKDKLG